MDEYFDASGRVYRKTLDATGRLTYTNAFGSKIPLKKHIYTEGQASAVMPIHILKLASFDMTNTRVSKKCNKCDSQIQIIVRGAGTTFYVCELCENYEQV